MAKPNWSKHVPLKWLDGTGMSNSSWQKWVFPKKSEQGKWLNTDNEQDFVWVSKDNIKVISAPGLSSWPSSTKDNFEFQVKHMEKKWLQLNYEIH